VIDLLTEAAEISKENVEPAMTVAHRVSLELRTAQDRIEQLAGERASRDPRNRAELWLGKEERDRGYAHAPMEANRSKPQMPAIKKGSGNIGRQRHPCLTKA
jgi:hypothetical protein